MRSALLLTLLFVSACSDGVMSDVVTGAEAQEALEICEPYGGLKSVSATQITISCGRYCTRVRPHELKVECNRTLRAVVPRAQPPENPSQ